MATTSYKSSSADSYSHNIVHPALKADLYRIQNAISIRTKTPSHEPSSHNPRQRPERAKLELVQVGHGPSGTYIATACSTDHVIIRKSRKGCAPLYRTIKLSRNRLQKLVAMDFSPRAKFLVCAMLDGTIHLRSTAHIFGDDRQNSSDCEKGPLTDSPSSSKQGGTLRQSRPFRGARRRRRLHRVSLTSMVSAAVSERSTESNEDGGISSSSTFPYYYSDAFATDTHPLYQYGGGGERAGGSSSALGSSGLNTAAGLGSREWRRNIFADEPGQESFQVENTSSPISVCKWWTSASGQDYLLIGRNDGTLTFLNLATRTMNTVRRTSRSVTIAAMWIAPLLPAGSVALILSLDGGYHLLPLEQVEEGRVGTHTSMSSSMGLAAAFGDHGALGAVGRGGGISAGYFPSSSINQQDKVGMMDTEKMGRRSTVTRHTEWIAQNSRAHRFRPISLNALSTTPSSSFKTSVRFSIQWCESSRGQTATYGYSRTRRVGIQHRACLGSHAQIVGKLIVCYSDTAAVASTSSPTVAAKRRARSSFRPYQSSSGPSSSSQPTERPRVYILSASLAKVPPLASEKMNHHHHHHHHHARSSGGGSSSGSSFVYQQQHLRKTSGSASSASATRKKKKKKKKKKGGGGFFDSKGGYSWRTALVQELCLDATRSEGSKRKRTARSTAGSPPSPSTSASSNDSKRMFSEVIFATNPPPVAAYFSYTPPRAGDINTGGGGGGGGREPPSAARKRRGVVGGHKGGGEASGARRINLRGGHQFNTGNASGSTRKRQNDYNSNNSSSSTDSILQEVFLWRGGSLVQHLTWKENESKNLRNHLRTPPPCPSSGWAEWWQEAKRLWWSGMCCGIDVQSLCEQQADKMFARFETRQAALEVYKLSRAPLPKRVGQHLLQRRFNNLITSPPRSVFLATATRAPFSSRDSTTAAEEEEEGGGGEGGTDTPMKILLQNQYLYLEGFAGGVGSSSGSYYSSKQVEEDLYRFVNANHLYSCKRAVAALISQLPSDFGLGAALEIARCREQKRICIARMAQKAVLDLSPSDFGSLISKDYTSLVLHTTEGGAIFRSLPAHQKFQMIQMQLSEWEDRENDLLFSSSPSGVASSGKSNSIDEDRRGGGHGGKRKTNRAGAAPPPSSSSPAGKSSSASRAMGRQNKGRNARKYNGQYDAKKESSSAAGDLLHRTTRTRPLLCAFGDYVRVLWTLVAALDQAWLSRLADFLNPSFTANKKRFRGSGLEGEITTLFLVTLLRLQHLRWKDAVSEEEEEEQVRERRNLDSQLLLDHHHHHHHHHIDGIVDEDDDDGQNARLQYQQGQEILEAHIRRRIDEYDNATVLYRALDWENYEAASVIYEAQQRWPEAIECRLHSQRTSDATVLKWVETKVRKMTRTQQARILPLVLRYWVVASRELPVEPLENCLLSIFPDIAMSLGHVLINGEGVCLDAEKQRRLGMTSGANSSRKILFEIPHFSWRLYTQLVNYGIRNL
eukprot:jgi/Bigna1/79877/fgenesh1_pg.66_\